MDELQVKKIVRAELQAMKRQIDIEIRRDLDALTETLRQEISSTGVNIASANSSTGTNNDNVINTQLVTMQQNTDKQIAMLKETTKELMVGFGSQITKQTYEKVIGEINKNIVPRIDSLIEYVNYSNQDGQEIITNYRRAVDQRVNTSMITDGKDDGRILSANVSMFFGDE
tara:strand:- start:105206 stop:105718 length:513 start_codon:yes stop_codon:yes gene_type:complete